jgi:protein TonB
MKRFIQFFTRLFLVFFVSFSSNFPVFAQTQNEEEEIIEVEMNCFDFDDIEIIIEDIEPIEDGEIEMCRFVTDVTAIEAPREEEEIFCIVEQSAIFEGGMNNFYDIVTNQIHFSEMMEEGRVFIQFVVDTTGKMTDIKMIRGLSEENDKEALRIMNLINEYHTWKPAEQRGKKVKVRMNMPIIFKLEKNQKSNTERVYRR